MAQVQPLFQGKTYTLTRALSFLDRQDLPAEHVADLVEGGRLCARQGLDVLSSGRPEPDLRRAVTALAELSLKFLDRAQSRVNESDRTDRDYLEREGVLTRLDEARTEYRQFHRWAGNMPDGTQETVFLA
jgi:hypothetical protein